jgi:predicted nucleic acid-binding protein
VGAVALDADVLIGFLDPGDDQHAAAANELEPWLREDHERLVAASVYAEILVHPVRRGTDRLVEDFLTAIEARIVAVDRPVARRAAELRARHPSLRLGDALPLAVALGQDATFLTLDRRLRRIARAAAGVSRAD